MKVRTKIFFFFKLSTSHKKKKEKNTHQESTENVSENLISPISVENLGLGDENVIFPVSSGAKSSKG